MRPDITILRENNKNAWNFSSGHSRDVQNRTRLQGERTEVHLRYV
jgi:hypothetical protein